MSRCSSRCNDPLLALLQGRGGEPVSGVAIGRDLGMTRAAVWKRIQVLRSAGYKVKSMARQGYVLDEIPDLLTRDVMEGWLTGEIFLPERYHFFPKLASTNAFAAELANAGVPEGTVVVADSQTHGRGRLGRVWESPSGVNLYFSMILRPAVSPRHTAQMTLISGLALAETVAGLGVTTAQIKWPNDLLLDGGKLAGILTEMAAEDDRVHHVVVGVGINVNGEMGSYSPEIQVVARSLRDHLKKMTLRAPLLADFLGRFERWYGLYLASGFAPIRKAWIARSGIRGKPVRCNLLKESFSGEAVDMDDEGFLLVLRHGDQELKRVMAGDVTPL
ncbi:MAG: biotin--[acetyl-CoA-carboxylase] ligase [Nitrospirae bacterium]|nr:biotin--[acetyl-CoA-carboxylase] ligase [Magnetococcales bacterium]HAT50978.1 biotin--[acetyl-CoA-carboxylase] ligase [Alphaproteobacteria bacterium]